MSVFKRTCAALSILCAASGAMAAPFASMPSLAPLGKTVTLTGGGFTPGAVVTVRIVGPGRETAMAAAVAAADGTVSHPVLVARSGAYTVELRTDVRGAAAVRMKFNVAN